MFDAFDKQMMARAVDLALTPAEPPYPNPRVGAVVAMDGAVLAEGCHESYTSPHAEFAALSKLNFSAPGATIYVTLEPCCSFPGKRNPSCADLIVKAGIKRAVIAVTHPEDGEDRGCAILEDADIQVDRGLLVEDAEWLIRGPHHFRHTGRPYVLAKWAMTLDGLIAPPNRKQGPISSPEGFALLHHLRHLIDGVLLGVGTAITDDPQLNCRLSGFRHPVRIVLDHDLRLPLSSKLAHPSADMKTLVFCSHSADASRAAALMAQGVELVRLRSDDRKRFAPPDVLHELAGRKILTLLVEGGASIHGSFFDARAVDEYFVLISPSLLGGAGSLGPVGGEGRGSIHSAVKLAGAKCFPVGRDFVITGFPVFED